MKLLFSFFLLGITFGAGPCLASCGPLLISYAAGTGKSVKESLGVYFLFSLSRLGVYVAAAVVVFFFGQALTQDTMGGMRRIIFFLGGLCIVGLGMLIVLKPGLNHRFCLKAQGMFLQRDVKTIIGLGLVTGIVPCAPLFSVISYIGLIAKTWHQGVSYAAAFGMGTVASPLLLLMVVSGYFPKMFKNKDKWYIVFNQVCGGVIIILGLNLIRRSM